jgi:hypothetical protein
VSQEVLAILDRGPAKPELGDALVRIASNTRHPLRTKATLALRRFADDPRARSILASAIQDSVRYPDPIERADFAEVLHDGGKAVPLLVPLLQSESRHIVVLAIKRLGKTGQVVAIAPLKEQTRRAEWRIVAEVYLALDALDSRGHALTEGQKQLLDRTGRVGNGAWRSSRALLEQLSMWPRSELHPFVMQMLGADASSKAVGLLGIWKVREALPTVDRLLWTKSGGPVRDVVGAYLAIDESEHAADQIVKRTEQYHDRFDFLSLVSAVCCPS